MSFGRQARWNSAISLAGQIVAVGFVGITARLLGPVEFGYYIWVTALPGMLVVFDLYLGLSLQTRLTELIAIGDMRGRDEIIWGFFWGMLAVSVAFVMIVTLGVLALTGLHLVNSPSAIPPWVVWLGLAQITASSLNVPLLVVGVGYNANHEAHRGSAWSLGADLVSRSLFLTVLGWTGSLRASLLTSSVAMVVVNVVPFIRFLQVYGIGYLRPSVNLVRRAIADLLNRGQGRRWAALRVVDGVYKNSELIVGAFVIGSARIGDFALLDRLSSALMLFASAAYLPLAPAMTSARAVGNRSRSTMLERKVGRYSAAGLVLFSAVFLLLGEGIVSLWAGRPIEIAFSVVVLMCVRACMRVLSTLQWHILMGRQLIQGLLLSTVAAAASYLVLYGSLLARYGVLSIVVSQVVAHTVFLACASRYLRGDQDAALDRLVEQ